MDCPNDAKRDLVLKRIIEIKFFNKMFSMMFETDDGLSRSSSFLERASSYELASNNHVSPEIEK